MADRTDPADFAASATLGATQLNALSRGEIVNIELTSNSAGTTSTETILTESFTLTDDRRIRFLATCTLRTSIAGGMQAALLLDGTQINRKNADTVAAGSDMFITFFKSKNVSAGAHTIALVTGVSGADGNTVTAIANGETGTHGVSVLSADDVAPWYS